MSRTANSEKTSAVYTGTDFVCAKLFPVVEDAVNQYKRLDSRIKAAEGDRDSAIKSYMESSDDADALEIRTQIADLQNALMNLANERIKTETLSDEAKNEIQTEMSVLKTKIRDGIAAITNVNNTLRTDFDGVNAAIEALGDPTKSGRGRKPGGTGSSLPRLSVTVYVKGGEIDQEFETFSAAANALNVEVRDLQLAFAEAAQVKHEDIKTVTKSIHFKFKVENTVFELRTTPKERAAWGSKVK